MKTPTITTMKADQVRIGDRIVKDEMRLRYEPFAVVVDIDIKHISDSVGYVKILLGTGHEPSSVIQIMAFNDDILEVETI